MFKITTKNRSVENGNWTAFRSPSGTAASGYVLFRTHKQTQSIPISALQCYYYCNFSIDVETITFSHQFFSLLSRYSSSKSAIIKESFVNLFIHYGNCFESLIRLLSVVCGDVFYQKWPALWGSVCIFYSSFVLHFQCSTFESFTSFHKCYILYVFFPH